jgi:putative membrane protein
MTQDSAKELQQDEGLALKSKIILPHEGPKVSEQTLRPGKTLDQNICWQPSPQDPQTGPTEPSSGKPARAGFSRKLALFCVALLVLSGIELVYTAVELYNSEDWLAGLWLSLLLAVCIFTSWQVIKEWQGLKRLKKQQIYQQQAQHYYNSPAIGQAKSYCLQLLGQMPENMDVHAQHWQQELAAHYNDKEIMVLFEQLVVAKADERAMAHISAHAGAAGVMIAVSPFALLDMAIVLWRNIRMLNQISEVYGVQLGYWGRVALIRSVFKTMLYAGASEILADAGNYALGAGLTGKLSTRIAQGMGAGVLTARIGLKAIQTCRPMPWLSCKKPGVSAVTGQLLGELKKLY